MKLNMLLYKFLFIPSDKLEGTDENYDSKLKGYFYIYSYIYNSDDSIKTTKFNFTDKLPVTIRHEIDKGSTVWGETNYIRGKIRFIISNREFLSAWQIKEIKRRCDIFE